MKSKSLIMIVTLSLSWAAVARADELVLKDGREFSGKLVRADAKTVEFRIQERIESFNTTEVSRIVFKEPELIAPARGRAEAPRGEPAIPEAPVAPEINTRNEPAPNAPTNISPRTATLPAGSPIIVRTLQQIDTDQNRVGEPFDASLEEPLSLDGQILAPRGSRVIGKIAYAEESGRVRGQSQLILELTELIVDGRSFPLRTTDYVEVGHSRAKRTAAAATGGAAVGAIIGAIAGGGKGAAIGAAAGAGAGAGIQVITGGQKLKVPAETILQFQLQKPLTLDAP